MTEDWTRCAEAPSIVNRQSDCLIPVGIPIAIRPLQTSPMSPTGHIFICRAIDRTLGLRSIMRKTIACSGE